MAIKDWMFLVLMPAEITVERLDEIALPLPLFISSVRSQPPHRVQGTAVVLTAR
jgi:KUP system potassium uptake protein